MGHKIGAERSQALPLPERVEDYEGENNPVRFIDAFVDGPVVKALDFGLHLPACVILFWRSAFSGGK